MTMKLPVNLSSDGHFRCTYNSMRLHNFTPQALRVVLHRMKILMNPHSVLGTGHIRAPDHSFYWNGSSAFCRQGKKNEDVEKRKTKKQLSQNTNVFDGFDILSC